MYAGTMQALVVILPKHLPVTGNNLAKRVTRDELAQAPAVEALQRLIEMVAEGRRLRGQRDEYEAIPLGDGDLVEREVLELESLRVQVRRGLSQLSLQSITPVVIRTDYSRRRKLPLGVWAKCRSAMTAGVVEAAQYSSFIAHEKDRLIAQLEGSVGSRCGDLARAARVHPVIAPDAGHLAL